MSLKEQVIKEAVHSLALDSDSREVYRIESVLRLALADYEIVMPENQTTALVADVSQDVKSYQMFFVSKKIEGLSVSSLKYYDTILSQFLRRVQKPLSAIAADDVRFYLASKGKASLVTLNNERRVLSSFFGWLCNEEYIQKNPMLKIKNIKEPKTVKKPFSATEIEEMRDACTNARDRAILEVLLSTGMRCSELCNANIADVDFMKGEVLVTGKGNKQRICYLNASAKKRLGDYLKARNDNNAALFVSMNRGAKRLLKGGVEFMIRNIGGQAGISKAHPHKLRRTSATMALQRGMPLEQVQKMLGHEKIDTTTRYAITADETVKHAHLRFM